MGELFFGNMFGFLRERTDIGSRIATTDAALVRLVGAMLLPLWVARPLLVLAFVCFPSVRRALGVKDHVEAFARTSVSAREKALAAGWTGGPHDLLQKMFELREARGDKLNFGIHDIEMESYNAYAAGGDTTAIALNSILYHLMRCPRAYDRLTAEIDAATAAGELARPVAYHEASRLPYLRAVVCEGMRVHPSVGLPLPRTVPLGGATVAGVRLPGGYRVGCNAAVVQCDRAVFGADADVFRPERWLYGDAARMERAMLEFGYGPRVCLGKNVCASLDLSVPLASPRSMRKRSKLTRVTDLAL